MHLVVTEEIILWVIMVRVMDNCASGGGTWCWVTVDAGGREGGGCEW